jgi:PAS domain-containing protein
MFWNNKNKQKEKDLKDAIRMMRLRDSQESLLSAATSTANAAQIVTTQLRTKLENTVKQLAATNTIVDDSLILCDSNGKVLSANLAATIIFSVHCGKNIAEYFQIDPDRGLVDQLTEGDVVTSDGVSINTKIEMLSWSDGSDGFLLLARTGRFTNIFTGTEARLIVRDNIIIASNNQVFKMFGYNSDDLLLNPISVLFSSDNLAEVEANVYNLQLNVEGINKDGGHINLIFTAVKVLLNDGTTGRIITLKENSKKYHEPNNPYNGIDMVVCFRPDFNITFVNKSYADFHKINRLSALGTDIRSIAANADVDKRVSVLTLENKTNRFQTQSPNGKVYDWIDHAIFDADGHVIEYMRVGRDITDIIHEMLKPTAI